MALPQRDCLCLLVLIQRGDIQANSRSDKDVGAIRLAGGRKLEVLMTQVHLLSVHLCSDLFASCHKLNIYHIIAYALHSDIFLSYNPGTFLHEEKIGGFRY